MDNKTHKPQRHVSLFTLKAKSIVKQHFGEEPIEISYPGGKKRRAVRVHLKNQSVIVTKRKRSKQSETELAVTKLLYMKGADVPKILFDENNWVIQEDVGEKRLSQLANELENINQKRDWLHIALDNLLNIHKIARENQLETKVPILGANTDWSQKMLATANSIGNKIALPSPKLTISKICKRIKIHDPHFIKWDCRLANAIVDPKKRNVIWFDWEHCGVRNAIDDLVWFVGDEHFPDELEDHIIKNYIDRFENTLSPDQAYDYFSHFIIVFILIRLSIHVHTKRKYKKWMNFRACLNSDTIAATPDIAKVILSKGQRWAERAELMKPLASWFEAIHERIETQKDFFDKNL